MGLFKSISRAFSTGTLGKVTSVGRTLSPGVPAAILPGGDPTTLTEIRSPSEQLGFEKEEQVARVAEDTVNLATYGPTVLSVYSGGTTVSLWGALGEAAIQLGSQYLSQRIAGSGSSAPTVMYTPTMSVTPAMGSLPPLIGRTLPALGGAAVGMAVRGAGAVARSAMTYCRRNPSWCATIGGTAAVAAMIESGQLPTIRRRRGRGLTPRDLRSFKRVANLIRGFCPTVRRIPTRATRHVRGTGITHA